MDYFLGIRAEIPRMKMIYASRPNIKRIVQLQPFPTVSDFRPQEQARSRKNSAAEKIQGKLHADSTRA